MYALLAMIVHAIVSSAAAWIIAPYSADPVVTRASLWTLSMASAAISTVGLVATSLYLSRRIRPVSGSIVGLLCGVLCSATVGLTFQGIDFSLILYLALLAPALLAVLLAVLLDRPKSGWQT